MTVPAALRELEKIEMIRMTDGKYRMQEYSRIILEEYCRTHKSDRSKRIAELLQKSYDVNSYTSEVDAIFWIQQLNENAMKKSRCATGIE